MCRNKKYYIILFLDVAQYLFTKATDPVTIICWEFYSYVDVKSNKMLSNITLLRTRVNCGLIGYISNLCSYFSTAKAAVLLTIFDVMARLELSWRLVTETCNGQLYDPDLVRDITFLGPSPQIWNVHVWIYNVGLETWKLVHYIAKTLNGWEYDRKDHM